MSFDTVPLKCNDTGPHVNSCLHRHFQLCFTRNRLGLKWTWTPLCVTTACKSERHKKEKKKKAYGISFPVYTNLYGDHSFSHKPSVFSEAAAFLYFLRPRGSRPSTAAWPAAAAVRLSTCISSQIKFVERSRLTDWVGSSWHAVDEDTGFFLSLLVWMGFRYQQRVLLIKPRTADRVRRGHRDSEETGLPRKRRLYFKSAV